METLKNLVLAGVQPAILDGRPYPYAVQRTPSSFFPPEERLNTNNGSSNGNGDDGKETVAKAIQQHVHELNPLLKLCEICETTNLADVPNDYFHKFDIVICSTKLSGVTQASRIAAATVEGGGKFYSADTFGLYGVAMLDLGTKHPFRREKGKDKLSGWMDASYPPLSEVLNKKLDGISDRWNKTVPKLWAVYRAYLAFAKDDYGTLWPSAENAQSFIAATKEWLSDEQGLSADYLGSHADLQVLATIADAEVSPVCAVLGGMLGQEVIKALSGKGEPAKNILMFDGTDGGCRSFFVG